MKNKKILIAYFSKTGNTLTIANYIKEKTNGILFEIKPETSYPEDYNITVDIARKELNANVRPSLNENLENIDEYEIIFLGYPVWWSTMPMPVFTFLESFNFNNKIIIPFATHEGTSFGRSIEDIKRIAPKATIQNKLAIVGSYVRNSNTKVYTWLDNIK